jgi:two-component system, NarL family, response regulator NreC
VTKISVLLAEDHETVRQGLKLLINGQPDMEVVAEAGDGAAAVERVAALHPAVAVVDVSMPKMNGLAATRTIRQTAPSTAVVALTRYADDAYVQELLKAGALAYVLKQSPSSELVEAVRSAASGRPYLDRSLAVRAGGTMRGPRDGRPAAPRVTDRETAVLRLMALCYSNKEIASDLELSVKTVEVHKANAMRKLGLSGRTDLVRYALLQGWLRDP